jgi:zinc transporter, ZIP family
MQIACVLGASVICVDLIVQQFPGQKSFRIQDSNVFLACSLSLSFGVMVFSALNSMLPSAKHYLQNAGYSDQAAGFALMACFIGGFVGIQTVSRLIHRYMPSHVVDCGHTHEDKDNHAHEHAHEHSCGGSRTPSHVSRPRLSRSHSAEAELPSVMENGHAAESTPLLGSGRISNGYPDVPSGSQGPRSGSFMVSITRSRTATADRRPSMIQKRVLSFVKDTKSNCDEQGPCYGYSDPCGQACFKLLSNRSSSSVRKPTIARTATEPFKKPTHSSGCHDDHIDEEEEPPMSPKSRTPVPIEEMEEGDDHSCHSMDSNEDLEAQHHHHVQNNAFLAIGLQTSIAIALHKFPEGFITYATNHANPRLGFSVFMALFVHNITEGFAMALPLYLALNSRIKAMAWSSVLGGLSQPLGAGIAALWFHVAKKTHWATPNAVAYACLFAITAGIMVSVALQLFVESLTLNHNRNLCIFFAFLGMALLGVSSAMVASH